MKIFILLFGLVSALQFSEAKPLHEREDTFLSSQVFMPLSEARNRWTISAFNPAKFKAGGVKERATMAVSIISNHQMIGKTSDEVRSVLGDSSGFFWSDYIPAYLIEQGWDKGNDSWQLVFLLDPQGKVNEVRIHKNCCPKKN